MDKGVSSFNNQRGGTGLSSANQQPGSTARLTGDGGKEEQDRRAQIFSPPATEAIASAATATSTRQTRSLDAKEAVIGEAKASPAHLKSVVGLDLAVEADR